MEQNIEKNIDVYSLVTNRIIELMDRGTIPWRQQWTTKGIPRNGITKRPYQSVNVLLLNSLPYDHNLFLTWRQIKTLGGSVLKGEQGHIVVFNKMLESQDEKGKIKKTFFLRYYKVFNIAQCKDLPKALFPEEGVEIEKLAHFEEIGDDMPNRPLVKVGGDQAYYNPQDDYINMPPIKKFRGAEAYYGLLFHELIHSTGHASRLGRKGITDKIVFGSQAYSFEELIAEMGACFLKSYCGISIDELENEVAYLQHWLEVLKNDKTFIIKASTASQKAVEYILNSKIADAVDYDQKDKVLVDEMELELELDEIYAD